MDTITIRLAGVFQAYGTETSFSHRNTLSYPKKSSIVGMIGAAMGYRRNDNNFIKKLNTLDYAVRIEQLGPVTTDFHIVQYQDYLDGKGSPKSGSKLTYREYLQDTVFLVALGSEDSELIDNIQYAISHPKFQIYLGRRSSVPSGVIQMETYEGKNPIEVLRSASWKASKWYQKANFKNKKVSLKIIADSELLPTAKVKVVRDKAISFSEYKKEFGFRGISKTKVTVSNPEYIESRTLHDVMAIL